MTIKLGKLVSGLATVAVLAAGWFFFAPTQLGGSVSYVQIYGTSMQPHFHLGDLVLTRKASSYHTGEIVAYRNGQLGGHVVMHRIIGSAGGRYTFKGDNNNFVDSYHPVPGELVGRMWLHIPAVGRYLMLLHGSRLYILGGVAALLALLGTAFGGGRRRGRRTRAERGTAPTPAAGSLGSLGLLPVGAAALLLAFGALGALSWLHPLKTTATRSGVYAQTGSFGYDAVVPGGERVYGKPSVTTGQPLFLQIVRSARFHFTYTFASSKTHAVSGRIGLDAVVSGANGWKRTLHIAPLRAFSGDHATTAGVLAFPPLLNLLHQVDTLSNVIDGTYTLTLKPRVTVRGSVSGAPVTETFAPTLPLTINPNQLQLQAGDANAPSPALTQTVQGSGTVQADASVSLLKLHLAVPVARMVSLGGSIAALLMLLVSLLVARQFRPVNEHEQIERMYGELLVDVTTLPVDSTARSVYTASFDGIARVAEQSGNVIMHLERTGHHSYVVESGGVLYRYGGRVDVPRVEEPALELAQGA